MTGLAMVLVLIGIASAIFSSANRDPAISAVGASNASVVADLTDSNSTQAKAPADQPLATLGAAPSTASTEEVNAAAIARQQEQAKR